MGRLGGDEDGTGSDVEGSERRAELVPRSGHLGLAAMDAAALTGTV